MIDDEFTSISDKSSHPRSATKARMIFERAVNIPEQQKRLD
jgi:hypothetical protein